VATLASLERRLNRAADSLDRSLRTIVGEVIASIGEEVVPATPVDTGFARANWRPSLNVAAESPISFLDPTGAATVAKIRVVSMRWRPGDVFFLRNNAEYIGDLNRGSSPQAPPGFVQASARRGAERAIASFQSGRLLAIR